MLLMLAVYYMGFHYLKNRHESIIRRPKCSKMIIKMFSTNSNIIISLIILKFYSSAWYYLATFRISNYWRMYLNKYFYDVNT